MFTGFLFFGKMSKFAVIDNILVSISGVSSESRIDSPEMAYLIVLQLVQLVNILIFSDCKPTFIHIKKVCCA